MSMKYLSLLLILTAVGCGAQSKAIADEPGKVVSMNHEGALSIILGGGCFWCLEAAYELVPGILDVESGYSGGDKENQSYEEVSTGQTGHAEVVRLSYDPEQVSLESIFDLFFKIHDPTTKDRQGGDVGTQYRSIVMYANEEQKSATMAAWSWPPCPACAACVEPAAVTVPPWAA